MERRRAALTMMLASLGLAACSPGPEPSIPACGAKLFQQTCAGCHRSDGLGGTAPDLTRLTMEGSGTFRASRS